VKFADRRHAGILLGAEVAAAAPADPVVYGLPRGGVPVAYEVAAALGCRLDVLVVRKVGVPFQPELAMGAIAEGDVIVRNDEIIDLARISETDFMAVVDSEREQLESRVQAYRSDEAPVPPEGRTAIVVDDGLATGSTAKAALAVLREQGAAAVWLAVPVGPRDSISDLGTVADRIVVLSQPRNFGAVGVWFRDFTQTTDEEVRALLSESPLA